MLRKNSENIHTVNCVELEPVILAAKFILPGNFVATSAEQSVARVFPYCSMIQSSMNHFD